MAKCPICGKENYCELERGEPIWACWCFGKEVPKELNEKHDTSKGCICEDCVDEFNRSKNDGN